MKSKIVGTSYEKILRFEEGPDLVFRRSSKGQGDFFSTKKIFMVLRRLFRGLRRGRETTEQISIWYYLNIQIARLQEPDIKKKQNTLRSPLESLRGVINSFLPSLPFFFPSKRRKEAKRRKEVNYFILLRPDSYYLFDISNKEFEIVIRISITDCK